MRWWNQQSFKKNILVQAIFGTKDVIYNSCDYLSQQIVAIPKFVRATISDKKTKKVITKIARIALEDLVLLLAVACANNYLQQQAKNYLKDHPDLNWLSVNKLIQAGAALLQAAVSSYKFRKNIKMLLRLTVLSFEAPEVLNNNQQKPESFPCNHCNLLRFIKGTFRDIVSHEATNGAIFFIRYIPFIGDILATILHSYHQGRYILTANLTSLGICSRHQEEYLKEYSELAMVYGLVYFVLSELPSKALERYTGIPPAFYKSTIQHLVLTLQILMSKHLDLPPLIRKSNRNLPDPLVAYIKKVGYLFDTMLDILKRQISCLLPQTDPAIQWDAILKSAEIFWSYRAIKIMRAIFLPRILRSKEAFINDPVIPWNPIRAKLIDAIDNMEWVQKNTLIKLISNQGSNITTKTLYLVFGLPKVLTRALLSFLRSQTVKDKLAEAKQALMAMQPDVPILLPANTTRFYLRSPEELPSAATLPLPSATRTTRALINANQEHNPAERSHDKSNLIFKKSANKFPLLFNNHHKKTIQQDADIQSRENNDQDIQVNSNIEVNNDESSKRRFAIAAIRPQATPVFNPKGIIGSSRRSNFFTEPKTKANVDHSLKVFHNQSPSS